MKHYYVHAAIRGILICIALFHIFGIMFGLFISIIMAVWEVKSAIDMSKTQEILLVGIGL